jgi:hypothetical protein
MQRDELIRSLAELSAEDAQEVFTEAAALRAGAASQADPSTQTEAAAQAGAAPETGGPSETGAAGDAAAAAEWAQTTESSNGPPPEVSRPVRPTPVMPAPLSVQSTIGPETELTTPWTDSGVPTLAGVREKIESRFARAEGQAVLDAESERARGEAEAEANRAKAAQEALDRIRQSLHGG